MDKKTFMRLIAISLLYFFLLYKIAILEEENGDQAAFISHLAAERYNVSEDNLTQFHRCNMKRLACTSRIPLSPGCNFIRFHAEYDKTQC